jgi:hypothetical protein
MRLIILPFSLNGNINAVISINPINAPCTISINPINANAAIKVLAIIHCNSKHSIECCYYWL